MQEYFLGVQVSQKYLFNFENKITASNPLAVYLLLPKHRSGHPKKYIFCITEK